MTDPITPSGQPTDLASLREMVADLCTAIATDSRDWSLARGDRRIYGLVLGWSDQDDEDKAPGLGKQMLVALAELEQTRAELAEALLMLRGAARAVHHRCELGYADIRRCEDADCNAWAHMLDRNGLLPQEWGPDWALATSAPQPKDVCGNCNDTIQRVDYTVTGWAHTGDAMVLTHDATPVVSVPTTAADTSGEPCICSTWREDTPFGFETIRSADATCPIHGEAEASGGEQATPTDDDLPECQRTGTCCTTCINDFGDCCKHNPAIKPRSLFRNCPVCGAEVRGVGVDDALTTTFLPCGHTEPHTPTAATSGTGTDGGEQRG